MLNTIPPAPNKTTPSQVAVHSAQPADDERVLYRFEFPDGGFVEITVSRDVDAELALQIIETSLPTLKAVTAIVEKTRKETARIIHQAYNPRVVDPS